MDAGTALSGFNQTSSLTGEIKEGVWSLLKDSQQALHGISGSSLHVQEMRCHFHQVRVRVSHGGRAAYRLRQIVDWISMS